MLNVPHADNRGVVQRAKMIDTRQCVMPWLFDASIAHVKETLALHSQMVDRYGMTVEIVMCASPEHADWQRFRQRLLLECCKDQNIKVHSRGPAAVTITITPNLRMDIVEGYVMIS